MISVCIPTYNGENYIKQQILSILNELGEDDEIVISDDGSTDMTLAIIEEINDKRIIVIKNEENIQCESYNNRTEKLLKKVSLNLQNALLHCKGD
ncbi:glycosyltransferase, partial [Escherichia coli]